MRNAYSLLAAVLSGVILIGEVQSADISSILGTAEIDRGLCVQIGIDDNGETISALAARNTFLVQGLAPTDEKVQAVRGMLQNAGLYGLAAIERREDFSALPYPENFINLLLVVPEILGNNVPSDDEIKRVIVPEPHGAALVRENGQWRKITKSRNAGMGDWTHYFHGPEQNSTSSDDIVQPKTSIKWISWFQHHGYGKSQTTGMRSESGLLIHEQKGYDRKEQALCGRDAFNGIKFWMHTRLQASNKTRLPLVLNDGVLYTCYDEDGRDMPLMAFDAHTGEVIRTYSGAAIQEATSSTELMGLVFAHNTLYQTYEKSVHAIDPESGTVKWQHQETEGLRILWPATSAGHDKLYYVIVSDEGSWSRWPAAILNAVVALDIETGDEVWRNTELAGKGVSNLIVHGDRLCFFRTNGIGSGPKDVNTDLGVLNADDGSVVWTKDYYAEAKEIRDGGDKDWVKTSFAFQPIIRGNDFWVINQGEAWSYDIGTGERKFAFRPQIPNQRCPRPVSTENFFIIGFGSWYKPESNTWYYQNVSRSDCGTPTLPANGMTYNTPNECTCFAQARGYAGFSSESISAPEPEADRLESGAGLSKRASSTNSVKGMSLRKSTAAISMTAVSPIWSRDPIKSGHYIKDMWYNTDVIPYPETEPVTVNNATYVAVVNEHRLEARDGENVKWSFVAGGRISRAPAVENGSVLFGSHDGWVYCLDENDGALKWRFRAAPKDRKIMAYGQLESAWPVYGVVMHNGLVAVSAGRHPELDGGIYFYGLNPDDGTVSWKGRMARFPGWEPYDNDNKELRNWENHVVNDALIVEDGRLLLPGSPYVHERFPSSTVEIIPDSPPSVGVADAARRQAAAGGIQIAYEKSAVRISFPKTGIHAQIGVFNLAGRCVFQEMKTFKGRYTINQDLPAGRYFVAVRTNDSFQSKDLTVIKR